MPGCSIELNLGSDEELQDFALHVRGDERAPTVVAHILGELGMRALDPSSDSGLFEQDPILQAESFAVGDPTGLMSSEIVVARPNEAAHVWS